MALLVIPVILCPNITGLAILISFGGILSGPVAFFGFGECFWLPHFLLRA